MTDLEQLQEQATSRKLASLQRIDDVRVHPNADALDIVRVLGWDVVAKRDDYKPGDLTVFFEIDSVVPTTPEFEFLANKNYRIRTQKLRGFISQGLCVKPEELAASEYFPDFFGLMGHFALQRVNEGDAEIYGYRDNDGRIVEACVGTDLTRVLNVTKYIAPIPACLSGVVKGNFPSYIPKTDEERGQSNPDLFIGLLDRPIVITEKLEGCSLTVFYHGSEVGVCSRNWELKPDESVYWRLARQYGLDKLALDGFAIQMEAIGAGIQGNIYKLNGLKAFVFGVYDINASKRLSHDEMCAFCQEFGLATVPVVFRQQPDQKMSDAFKTLDDVMAYSRGKSVLNPDVQREGIVVKPLYEFSQSRTSFKAVNPDYLL